MNDWSQGQMISLVAMLGWLILVGSALASHRLGASQIVKMALVWVAIFAGGFVIVSFIM